VSLSLAYYYNELIKQLNENKINQFPPDVNNNNNNININLQLENKQLKNQIQELMKANKDNILLNDKIISENKNIQNNDLLSKINELTLENQKYKETITKLESDIKKKNEELDGMKAVIFKLQKDLEKKRDEDEKYEKKKCIFNNFEKRE
jgi:SMC interacting uncharacterized protein involved in chromosome segregation